MWARSQVFRSAWTRYHSVFGIRFVCTSAGSAWGYPEVASGRIASAENFIRNDCGHFVSMRASFASNSAMADRMSFCSLPTGAPQEAQVPASASQPV